MVNRIAHCITRTVFMGYLDLLREGASATDIREHLVSGKPAAITIRIPDTLRDAAKDEAAIRGTTFSALVRESVIKELTDNK